ncbi:MAG: HAMP domain-containing sensor histidine kinase [Planctomycetota bacterium]
MNANQPKIYIFIVLLIVIPALLLSCISLVQIHKERIRLRERIERQFVLELQKIRRDLFIVNEKMEHELQSTLKEFSQPEFASYIPLGNQLLEKYPTLTAFFFLNSNGQLLYPLPPEKRGWPDILDVELHEAQQIEIQKSPEEAYKRYIEIWGKLGDDPMLLNLLARCARKIGQQERAKDFYRRLYELEAQVQTPMSFIATYELLILETKETPLKPFENQARQEQIFRLLEKLVEAEPHLEGGFFDFLFPKILAMLEPRSLTEEEKNWEHRILDFHQKNQKESRQLNRFHQIKDLIFARLKEHPESSYWTDMEQKEVYFYVKPAKDSLGATAIFCLETNELLERLKLLVESRNELISNAPEMVHYGFLSHPIPSLALQLTLEPILPWLTLTAEIKDMEGLAYAATTSTYSYLAAVIVATLTILVGLVLILFIVHQSLHVANMKSDFVSMVTHELKTPLTSIRMFVETLQLGRIKDEKEQQECLSVIMSESERLSRLIDNVLTFSKTEKNTYTLHFQEEDLWKVVSGAVQVFKSQVDILRCQIRLIPPTHPLPRVWIDSDSIQEIIQNLLSNAYKYSKETVTIDIFFQQTPTHLIVEVADNGIGVPEKYHKKIFEKFFRVDDHLTNQVDGCGLGLAISRNAARTNKGDLKIVSSEVGKGSCFALLLPYPLKNW